VTPPIQQFSHCPLAQGKRQKGGQKAGKNLLRAKRSKIGGK
jgi:hypothetical protein